MNHLSRFPDKSNSPTHHRSVSISDIRLTRVTTNSGDTAASEGGSTTVTASVQQSQTTSAAVVGSNASSQLNSATSLSQNSAGATIVTIKQETLAPVDNLVGSFVDSTTFLHSPSNSQMVNPNLVQSNCGLGGASGECSN